MKNVMTRPVTAGIIFGFAGGIALIAATLITTKGILQISPYPVFVIAAILMIKYTNSASNMFQRLFKAGFLTFIIMSFIVYMYIIIFINPNSGIGLTGHLWRSALVIAMASLSSSLVSFIAKPVEIKNNKPDKY